MSWLSKTWITLLYAAIGAVFAPPVIYFVAATFWGLVKVVWAAVLVAVGPGHTPKERIEALYRLVVALVIVPFLVVTAAMILRVAYLVVKGVLK